MEQNGPAKVGQAVPDFKLETYEPATGGFGEVSLADLKAQGKWTILVFYPADFTFVCATELADLADEYANIVALGAEVITVSTDTKFTHLAWHREEKSVENAKYLMGADRTGEVARLFGVYDGSGNALRGTFIISPDGNLVAAEVNFFNVGRNAAELVRKLNANVYLSQHPEQACPARWDTGKKTLTPSADLVGNVYEALHS